MPRPYAFAGRHLIMNQAIAFLGLGAMGIPMARNLAAAGFRVRVWNRSREKAAALAGVETAATPRAAAMNVSFAITMLADDAAVEAVTFGQDGIIRGLSGGAVHIGMSTISVALAERLVEAHRSAGQAYVAAPVFGRPDAAAAKMLWIVCGGQPTDLDRCAPVFQALGQGTFAMGTAPQASLTKLVGNFLIVATIESLAEALVLGEKGGIDPQRLFEMLTATIFGSPVVRNYGARIVATEFEPAGFALPLGLKDVNLALRAAADLGSPLPVAQVVREHLLQALARGRDGYDWAGLASVIREAAGLAEKRIED